MRALIGSLLGTALAGALTCQAARAGEAVIPAGGSLSPASTLAGAPAPPAAPAPTRAPDPFATGGNSFDGAEAHGGPAPGAGAQTLIGDAGTGSFFARVPVLANSSAKITENESPAPMDRVFVTYNFYDRIRTGVEGIRPDLHRETAGFEKTFLGGSASFGVRAPFFQTTDSQGLLVSSEFGDLSLLAKWAFLGDKESGSLLSAGLVVTVPTGPDNFLPDGTKVHSTLLQPYLGYYLNFGQFYVEGFSAVILPSEGRDVTLWTNDLGVGYRLYEDGEKARGITALTPTVEAHLADPLNHRGDPTADHAGLPDILIITGGVHVRVCQNKVFTFGYALPVTGPRPFDWEVIGQFNCRF